MGCEERLSWVEGRVEKDWEGNREMGFRDPSQPRKGWFTECFPLPSPDLVAL